MSDIYIDVVNIVENEDGSAIYTFEMNEAAQNVLIKEGLISILRKEMEETQDEKNPCCGTCCTDVSDKG